jgi:hypothetical protein
MRENQHHTKILIPVRIATIKNTTNNRFGENVGKKEPSYTDGWNAS